MSKSGEFILKASGLPWSTTSKDILDFFNDCDIVGGEEGIHLTVDDKGRASGNCFVVFASDTDLEKAKAHNKEHIGSRYVEIHDSNHAEMDWQMNRNPDQDRMGGGESDSTFAKLRGLPYGATKDDVANFFSGIEIVPYGITITMDQNGRCSGEAYVEFTSQDGVEAALNKNKEKIGHRYIEIFKCSKNDIKHVSQSNSFGGGYQGRSRGGGRPGPYDRPGGGYGGFGDANSLGPSGFNTGGLAVRRGGRGGGRNMGEGNGVQNQQSTTGHMVHMRGLPFTATQADVYQFFAPLKPVALRILYEDSGRPAGECDVDFSSHSDAESAMSKDKQNMGPRYIELFLRSKESSNSWSNVQPLLSSNTLGMNSVGYGASHSSAPGTDYGGSLSGGGGGAIGDYNSNGYGYGANSGYSSFNEKTSYPNIPQSTGSSYYSNSY